MVLSMQTGRLRTKSTLVSTMAVYEFCYPLP